MPPRKKVSKEVVAPIPEIVAEPVQEILSTQSTTIENLEQIGSQTIPITVKPKRERKASSKHQVVAVITQDGIQGMFTPEIKRPLIAHLPIHSYDVKFYDKPLTYDPTPPGNPVAYEDTMTNPFAELNENQPTLEPTKEFVEFSEPVVQQQNSQATTKKGAQTTQQAHTLIEYGPTKLLASYGSSSETKELPKSTTVACFWCCEVFDGRPCVIPSYIADDVWHVYGNFCTPHCASAYLLSELIDTHVRWGRLALLHRLYASSCGGRIYPSPHREVLERFGGHMKTEQFRKICEERKIRVDVHLPPMVSILASMDTKPIDFYETSLRNTVATIPVINQVDTGLKLKRTKPLKDRESTLDACLNIRMKS
jgi:hypothetical protein